MKKYEKNKNSEIRMAGKGMKEPKKEANQKFNAVMDNTGEKARNFGASLCRGFYPMEK